MEWMTRADDTILEFLLNDGNKPLNASPTFVEANIDYKISHIRSRMRKLHESGLIEYYDEDRGLYRITDRGRDYLSGELDAEDLEDIGE
ncbi:phage PhiH1 repressor protein [Halorubrum distributum JCM 9100]|uniref:Phage PhiH1 repressor protein n=2 Tax=Halorubrum distributum TaxID=29283 RepID=M0EWC5_9EURY|nr:phage PhiH1 repressor protein [Halorubrum distributum JCM 9100]ELZ52847.1 phage PhiH1 repressor protein [Halorubrum distributum JCM 10118]